MHYINHYHSPLGTILLAADDTGLTGLWFEGQKYFAQGLDKETEEKEFFDFRTFFAHCVSFLSKIVLQGGILSIKKSVPVSKDGW